MSLLFLEGNHLYQTKWFCLILVLNFCLSSCPGPVEVEVLLPKITGITGNGTRSGISTDNDELNTILDRIDAKNRFQDTWIIHGENLQDISKAELIQNGEVVFSEEDGLLVIQGGNTMKIQLKLPAMLVAGAFTLVLNGSSGKVEAQVYVLQGEKGDKGDPGQDENPNCPRGYVQKTQITDYVYCEKDLGNGRFDVMVKIGNFWIDKYESSLWEKPTCNGNQYGLEANDAQKVGFTNNGNWSKPLYSCSISHVQPAGGITWFQAQQACALSGKSLCTNEQWQAAVSGTIDPSEPSTGTLQECKTKIGDNENNKSARDTGNATHCISKWGAEDMIGNRNEWVSLWVMEPGRNDYDNDKWPEASGAPYGSDTYYHGGLTSRSDATPTEPPIKTSGSHKVYNEGIAGGSRLPAALQRGGHTGAGTDAGAFYATADAAPSDTWGGCGARCCRFW